MMANLYWQKVRADHFAIHFLALGFCPRLLTQDIKNFALLLILIYARSPYSDPDRENAEIRLKRVLFALKLGIKLEFGCKLYLDINLSEVKDHFSSHKLHGVETSFVYLEKTFQKENLLPFIRDREK